MSSLSASRGPTPDEDITLAQSKRDFMDWLIDEWGEESFPASDPPGGLPPSLMADRRGTTKKPRAAPVVS